LTLMPDGRIDPNAPPPAADPGAAPLSGVDSGLSAVGMDAPLHFTLKDVNGVEVKLDSFKGKVVLVNFWATWCGPCKVEIPDLIELQNEFPNQLVVVGIDVRRVAGGFEVFTHGGRKPTGLDAVSWAAECERLGAGEVVLNSMDADGTKNGFDIELTRLVGESCNLPVVASGGVGTLDHFVEGAVEGQADAVLAASVFHYGEFTVRQAKEHLAAAGVAVRPA